jgi:hypothetical protein
MGLPCSKNVVETERWGIDGCCPHSRTNRPATLFDLVEPVMIPCYFWVANSKGEVAGFAAAATATACNCFAQQMLSSPRWFLSCVDNRVVVTLDI